VALLGVLVRFVSSKRLREVATWAQFVVFIMVYGGFFIAQRSLGGASGIHLGAVPALLFAPSSWAAMPLAHGADAAGLAGAVLAVAVPVVLFVLAVRVIAASYEGKIADAAVVETRTVRATRMAGGGGLLWRSAEEKGMALLIANFFGQDSQFRMGVLTIIPVTVLYVVIILFAHRAPIADPFTQAGRAGFGSTMLLYLAVGFFPTYMKSALTYSGQAEASWIFSVSPANRLLILRAARRFILVFFVTPYMILLGVLHAVLTHAVLHTVQHFAVIAVLVLIEIDVLLLFFPRMPFSRMTAAGRRGAGPLVRMLAGVILLLPLFLMVDFVYPSTVAYWAALAGLCIAMVILRLVGNQHAARRLGAEEFIA